MGSKATNTRAHSTTLVYQLLCVDILDRNDPLTEALTLDVVAVNPSVGSNNVRLQHARQNLTAHFLAVRFLVFCH